MPKICLIGLVYWALSVLLWLIFRSIYAWRVICRGSIFRSMLSRGKIYGPHWSLQISSMPVNTSSFSTNSKDKNKSIASSKDIASKRIKNAAISNFKSKLDHPFRKDFLDLLRWFLFFKLWITGWLSIPKIFIIIIINTISHILEKVIASDAANRYSHTYSPIKIILHASP